jgi:hypothetical protein
MKNVIAKSAWAMLMVTVLATSGCSMFHEPSIVDYDHESEQYKQLAQSALDGIKQNHISIYSGASVEGLARILRELDISVTSELDLGAFIYTGNTLTSVDALTALELVLTNTSLDFELIHAGIHIKLSEYTRVNMLSDMTKFDWRTVEEGAAPLMVRSVRGVEYQVGTLLDDRVANTFYINAPYSVRKNVIAFIEEYRNQKRKIDSVGIVKASN